MQKVLEAHDTESRVLVPSMSTGADQWVPSNMNARPWLSTVTQNEAEVQDTSFSGIAFPRMSVSMRVGADQPEPVRTNALPFWSTIAQNVDVGQEIAEGL